MAKNIISIDLGGTKVLSALIDPKGEIIQRVKIATDITKGNDFLLSRVADSVKKLLEATSLSEDDVKCVALGVPGTVNPDSGVIGNAPNLKISNYNIKEELQKHFSMPLLIENDVNLAALGIKRFEHLENLNNALVVFVGTGIGAALIFGGQLYRGSSFFAGEIGQMIIDKKGRFLTKGKECTFESIASRTAMVKGIRKELRAGHKSVLQASDKNIKSKSLLKAMQKGDPLVSRYIKSSSGLIGKVLANIVTLLNIDTIVLGGGVIEALHEYMLPEIQKTFSSSVLKEPGSIVNICYTKLGDDAALFGGLELAREFLPD